MFPAIGKLRVGWTIVALGLVAGFASSAWAAVSGSFVAVVNEATGFADSRKSVTFYDAEDIAGGPLFSVFVPFEIHGGSSTAYEEPQTITVNPSTGDIYLLAFDSGTTVGGVDDNATPDNMSDDDTIADLDLYRLNFQPVLNHWLANYQGTDVRSLMGALAVGGPAPTTTGGSSASALQDYVTYGVTTPYGPQLMLDLVHGPSPEGVFDASHSNTFTLPGAIEKVGEINRNVYTGASNFWPGAVDFIDPDTLFYVDDSRAPFADDNAANDHDYRIIERVSTSPGVATSDGIHGGYNRTTTESWESRRIGQVHLDGDPPMGFSEPESVAFYHDPASGVQGVWVVEGDFPAVGDSVSFLQLDANLDVVGYRPFSAPGGVPFPAPLDNDPAVGNDNTGSADNVFVDADTGDVIIVESSFNDETFGGTNTEPGVLRLHVSSYDNGSGEIVFSGWDQKTLLMPAKDPGDTGFEFGFFSTYDSATDTVYFFSPGFGSETPPFEMDIHALDLTTGETTSYLNVDNSVNLFVGGNNRTFGDKAVAFTVATIRLAGDYNGDDKVDAADYVVWRNALNQSVTLPNDTTPGTVTDDDYTVWQANFGNMVAGNGGQGSAAIPEPASILLLLVSALTACCRRCR